MSPPATTDESRLLRAVIGLLEAELQTVRKALNEWGREHPAEARPRLNAE